MPEPLAMPPIWHSTPSHSNAKACSFFTVSVVMMASAAEALPLSLSCAAQAGMPLSKGVRVICWPITPVEAMITSSGRMFSARAVSWLMP